MAITHVKGDFFDAEHGADHRAFGFHGSAKAAAPAKTRASKSRPAPMPPDDDADDGSEIGGEGTYVARTSGGRINKAIGGGMPMGGAGGPPGPMPPPQMALPGGAPGAAMPPGPPPTAGPGGGSGLMDRATLTMPVPDAKKAAAGMMNVGRVVGAHQAVSGLANAARARLSGVPQAPNAPARMRRPTIQPQAAPAGLRDGGPLSAADRNALPKEDFALPGGRYPINDANHARNALARVSGNGTPDEKSRVRAAVHRKYPDIGKE